MTTKNEYIIQARSENPKPQYQTVNGEQIELSDDEYEASIEAWADMRVEQDMAETKAAELKATKRSAYTKLGLTAEEIEALLG